MNRRRFLHGALHGTAGLALSATPALWSAAEAAATSVSFALVSPRSAGCDPNRVQDLLRWVGTRPAGSLVVLRGGKLVAKAGDSKKARDIKSATKSIGSALLGLALADGKLALDTQVDTILPAIDHVPVDPGVVGGRKNVVRLDWNRLISVRRLATQSAGFTKPGTEGALLFQPGSRFSYSDGGPNWLADALTTRYRADLNKLAFERIFGPIGITTTDLRWRTNIYRTPTLGGVARREFGSGITANVEALARIGSLFLDGGAWAGRQIIQRDFAIAAGQRQVASVPALDTARRADPLHYGFLWWNNGDGAIRNVPTDAFWAWGLGDALIVVVPSLGLVAARTGAAWQPGWTPDYSVLATFYQKLCGIVL